MLNFESYPVGRSSPPADLEFEHLYGSLRHLETFYPQFASWFWAKVVPGCGDQSRRILQASAGERLAGIAILKRSPFERKVCTLWVARFARGCGFGQRLLSDSLEWLEADKPLITVCQERLHDLQPLLVKFGFKLEQAAQSLYRPERFEYVFNGLMSQPQAVLQCHHVPTPYLEERASRSFSLSARSAHL
jgi:GNAT superfamily N-acetyltransferase